MSNRAKAPKPSSSPSQRPWDAHGLVILINCIFGGVAAVYATTRSVTITGLSAVCIVILVCRVLDADRRPEPLVPRDRVERKE